MNDPAELVVERRAHTLVARLNRPDARNALTPSLASLGGALRAGEDDPDVRAIALTGTGDRAFCAGMDLRAFADGGFDLADDGDADAYFRLLRGRIRVPVIGAANGPLGVRATKELVHLGVADLDAAWHRLGELQPTVFASEDAAEGARAFVEKRPPVWRGR
jgi:enoyl-CoA hydratase/carnithine racemase